MIDLKFNPTVKDLRVFAGLQVVFFALVAWLLYRRGGTADTCGVIVGVSAVAGVTGVLVPSLIRPVYRLWMIAVFPIGWVISYAAVAIVFYLVITPIGLIMRMAGCDPLTRTFELEQKTYWVEHVPERDSSRYFRQF